MTTILVEPGDAGELARSVSSEPVQLALREHPEATVRSEAVDRDAGGAYQDFGATALVLLGTPAVIAGVKGLFSVIRTAIAEAHKTRRRRSSEDHEYRKLVLVLDAKREEIDLAAEADVIEARVAALESAAVALVSS